jgi:Transposase DDE domain group 1
VGSLRFLGRCAGQRDLGGGTGSAQTAKRTPHCAASECGRGGSSGWIVSLWCDQSIRGCAILAWGERPSPKISSWEQKSSEGLQEGRHFHGYYYDFCFLPLYIFCGERLLVSYLRESNIDSAKHAWAILALVKRYAIGACSGWNHPLAPTENRRGHHSKHPAHSIVVEFQLPTATALLLLLGSVLRVSLQSGADPGTRKTMVASAGCLPMPLLRHHLARFSAKLFAINSSRIPPQHKPPSGAKSGLVHARLSGQSVDRFHQWLNACTAVSTIFWRDCSLRSFGSRAPEP